MLPVIIKNKHSQQAHKGVDIAPPPPVDLTELIKDAPEKGLWLALDCVQDPQNLGALFRTAAFFGVRGIILPKDRSAPITPTVIDVACGGVAHIPYAVVTNFSRALEECKEAGFWILGATEHQGDEIATVPRDRRWVLVLGSEENGMRRLTEENCDLFVRIPAKGKVTSLNVSVAGGVLISALA